ncbi:CIC11C00000001941 [Sungouiella intermedia]|uniref:CIC11C00000001941 n=1 Tax=Sungouiella intermedia TaxID=45354 RepID=A0A1L0C549_9ASCO|nr:CIC11C00000001941 [[Candida] intermedia]
MSIPEHPADPGPFSAQHGYNDIQIKTQKYLDKPTPLARKEGKAQEFINSKTDREHQKKYGKKLFNFLINAACH